LVSSNIIIQGRKQLIIQRTDVQQAYIRYSEVKKEKQVKSNEKQWYTPSHSQSAVTSREHRASAQSVVAPTRARRPAKLLGALVSVDVRSEIRILVADLEVRLDVAAGEALARPAAEVALEGTLVLVPEVTVKNLDVVLDVGDKPMLEAPALVDGGAGAPGPCTSP
jgi:hypothetical protein